MQMSLGIGGRYRLLYVPFCLSALLMRLTSDRVRRHHRAGAAVARITGDGAQVGNLGLLRGGGRTQCWCQPLDRQRQEERSHEETQRCQKAGGQ
jgi:hypothetical protein